MATNRWNKYRNVNKYILRILGTNSHVTTNGVRNALWNKYNLDLSWNTVSKYMKDLKASGHVECLKEDTVYIWKGI